MGGWGGVGVGGWGGGGGVKLVSCTVFHSKKEELLMINITLGNEKVILRGHDHLLENRLLEKSA